MSEQTRTVEPGCFGTVAWLILVFALITIAGAVGRAANALERIEQHMAAP